VRLYGSVIYEVYCGVIERDKVQPRLKVRQRLMTVVQVAAAQRVAAVEDWEVSP